MNKKDLIEQVVNSQINGSALSSKIIYLSNDEFQELYRKVFIGDNKLEHDTIVLGYVIFKNNFQ